MNRNPPKHVCESLRKEVNFGCPVNGCGVPYLVYHHFDPPWSQKHHHNPEGMIALCAKDANLADGCRWTKDQLRHMKQEPYVRLGEISDVYGYLRRNVVTIIGNVAFDVRNVLEINGERVIGFERDKEGYDRLNLLIRDDKGKPVLVMENNDWSAYTKDLFDLRCSAQGKELEIASTDGLTHFEMRFDDYTLDDFKQLLSSRASGRNIEWLISGMGNPETIPTWTIKGKLRWGNSYIDIRDFEIEDLLRHNIFSMNFIAGGRAAFSFG